MMSRLWHTRQNQSIKLLRPLLVAINHNRPHHLTSTITDSNRIKTVLNLQPNLPRCLHNVSIRLTDRHIASTKQAWNSMGSREMRMRPAWAENSKLMIVMEAIVPNKEGSREIPITGTLQQEASKERQIVERQVVRVSLNLMLRKRKKWCRLIYSMTLQSLKIHHPTSNLHPMALTSNSIQVLLLSRFQRTSLN